MQGLGQNLLLGEELALLLVHVVPVLLLALLGAVGGHLAPGTLLDGGLVLGLLPPKIQTVVTTLHSSILTQHTGHVATKV